MRLARNTARMTHAYNKVQETRQQKKALNVVDEELASLKAHKKRMPQELKNSR